MRPKVKFLTAVWGEAYIARFAELALPSFLAPGNLPALAAGSELEVVIMTRGRDIDAFEAHDTFRRLRQTCALRFVEIDDLITTAVYGVTLTLAYTRAIVACGRDMLDTHFVFMNADFVLADGSLRSLLKHILAGRSIVLGPSFRATAEAIEPRLHAAVRAGSGVLAIPPRELAGLALAHPHPTTIAKTVNQGFCHSVHPNQFFWQVDEKTMLGRYYLIFMLCLKPERVIKTINSYCDYAFIPEMCPSGDEAIMGDSDEFFMLELQHRDQEMFLLQLGRLPDREIATSLAKWTTAEHRRAAGYDVVFHAGDVPPGIAGAKAEARAFIDRIGRVLRRPLPHAHHWHWTGGVEAFQYRRAEQGLPDKPPELDQTPGPFQLRRVLRAAVKPWRNFFRLVLAGRSPLLTPFHPSWLDYVHLSNALEAIVTAPGAHALVVRDAPELVDRFVRGGAPVRFATPRDVLRRGGLPALPADSGRYSHVFIFLLRNDLWQMHRLIARCQPLLKDAQSACQVFVHHLHGEFEGGNFSSELMQHLEAIVGWPPRATQFSFVGGGLKRFNRKLLYRLGEHYRRFGIAALLWVLPALAVGMPYVLLSNLLLQRRQPGDRSVQYCSSMLFRVSLEQSAPRQPSSLSSQLEQSRQSPAVTANEFALQIPPRNLV